MFVLPADRFALQVAVVMYGKINKQATPDLSSLQTCLLTINDNCGEVVLFLSSCSGFVC